MSILIKGMKMPTCCDECAFVKTVGLDRWKCELSGCKYAAWDVGWADGTDNKYIRHSSCPLVPVPPHGDLIDRDALLNLLNKCMFPSDMVTTTAVGMATNWIKDAPTIIPASGG